MTAPHRYRWTHRALAAAAALALGTGLAVAFAAPASAVAVNVSTEAELTSALADSTTTSVTLLNSITVAAGTLTMSAPSVQLNLFGFALNAHNVQLDSGSALTIIDSAGGGTLVADATTVLDVAGIQVPSGASLDIKSGTVTATGGTTGAANDGGAGIGTGAFGGTAGAITIDGGTVTANGGPFGAGIGGGRGEPASTVTINAGTVTANGGGGVGDGAAGIGSGSDMSGVGAGTIRINGGNVTANGGVGPTTSGAGIGGGSVDAPGGVVTITAGTVTANGGSHSPSFGSAGIGGSDDAGGGFLDVQGGTVTANGGIDSAGIGGSSGAGADVTVEGGTIVATGGFNGAGIGGGFNASGGSLTATGGTITATGGFGSAAIGGGGDSNTGGGGDGGAVTLDFGSTVTATATGSSVIGAGGTNADLGSLVIGGQLTINSNLTVPVGWDATVESTGVLQGGGALNGAGNIVNDGIIKNTAVTDALDTPGGLHITVHDFLVTFDGNDASATPASTPVRLYATTFATGNRTIPTVTRTDWAFSSWNSATDGSSTTFGTTSGVSANRTVYAQWTKEHLVITPSSSTVIAGGSLTFTVEAFTPANVSLGDFTTQVDFTTDNGSDVVSLVNPSMIGFTDAGTHVITATLQSDHTVVGTVDITVTPDLADIQTLTLTPSQTIVQQGGTVTFTTSGTDIYGNSLGNASSSATLTSNFAVDQISGNSITFPHASTHVITSTIAGVSTGIDITVDPVLGATGVNTIPTIAMGISLLGSGIVLLVYYFYRRRRTA